MSNSATPTCEGCSPQGKLLTHITTVAELRGFLKGVPACTAVATLLDGRYDLARCGVGFAVEELTLDDGQKKVCLRVDA